MPMTTVVSISNPAPTLSANVTGSSWSELCEPDAVNGEMAASSLLSLDAVADPGALSKNERLSARNVNAATSTMPMPVIHTASGNDFHAPMRIVISAANPLNPGIPIEAAEAMTKVNAANGSARFNC